MLNGYHSVRSAAVTAANRRGAIDHTPPKQISETYNSPRAALPDEPLNQTRRQQRGNDRRNRPSSGTASQRTS